MASESRFSSSAMGAVAAMAAGFAWSAMVGCGPVQTMSATVRSSPNSVSVFWSTSMRAASPGRSTAKKYRNLLSCRKW